jgi:ABC-type transporter Mla subunit MlaD
MKRKFLLLLILTGLFNSCSNNYKTIYLKADSVGGLSNEATVTINGFKIGHVENIALDKKGKTTAKLKIDKELELPIDTKFKIESQDLLGTKGISVTVGTNTQILKDSDTIIGTREETNLSIDSLIVKVKGIFDNLTEANQQDSILIELRRLNDNLEQLKK